MRVIYPLMIVVLSTIITLTALKYSIKYLSIATEYMLYKHIGGGTEYLITDYKIRPLGDCILTLDVIDKYYQEYDTISNTNIRVCYRLTDMSLYWTTNYINSELYKIITELEITFRYEEGSLSGMKFK